MNNSQRNGTGADDYDLDAAVQDIMRICAGIPENEKSFFQKFSEDINDFYIRIRSPQIRIAVIGITSSGKSTLLNTMLGRNYLPTRAAPSSGRQVLCAYGDSHRAEIFFEDGRKPKIIQDNPRAIIEKLELYGDEKNNPGNQYHIKEIHVFSRDFIADRNLVFVDTPGLDAYGLKTHEEITLNLVLPTVDMILYLTTVKPDSDGKNLEFINKIDRATSSLKPLIVVQNQIDSVVEKRDKTHGVLKTKQEVCQEHCNRLKKMLAGASNPSVRSAAVVQISAKKGIGIKQLGKTLDSAIAQYRKGIKGRYKKQFCIYLSNMEQQISDILLTSADKEKKRKEREKELSSYEKHVNEILESFDSFSKSFDDFGKTVSQQFEDLWTSIHNKYKTRVEGVYTNPESLPPEIISKKEQFTRLIGDAGEKVLSFVKESNRLIQVACNDLGLDEKQVYQKDLYSKIDNTLSDCTEEKSETHTEWVEKKGFWAWVARKLGWGGYRKHTYTKTRIEHNIRDTLIKISSLYENFSQSNNSYFSKLRDNIGNCTSRMREELSKKKNELENQYSVEVSSRTAKLVLDTIRKYLKKDNDPLETDVGSIRIQTEPLPEDDPVSEYEADSLAYDLYRLAELHQFDSHNAYFRDMLERSGMPEISICGWDQESGDILQKFEDIFIPDETRENVCIHKINFNFCGKRDLPKQDRQLVFLLLNAFQPGSAKNSLYQAMPEGSGRQGTGSFPGTEWLKKAASAGRIVWVMDSVKEAVGDKGNDNLMEVFHEMEKVADDFQQAAKPFDIMALDEDLFYSILFHELYFHVATAVAANQWTAQDDRERFVKQMREFLLLDQPGAKSAEAKKQVEKAGTYLNEYLNIIEHNKEISGK